LAARLHLSVRRMSEVFREEIGVSPHEFLVRQRLNRAIDQLVNTDRPIKAIAAVVGYESLRQPYLPEIVLSPSGPFSAFDPTCS
jgi:transcriptional regulator GlxA family with amidase domain